MKKEKKAVPDELVIKLVDSIKLYNKGRLKEVCPNNVLTTIKKLRKSDWTNPVKVDYNEYVMVNPAKKTFARIYVHSDDIVIIVDDIMEDPLMDIGNMETIFGNKYVRCSRFIGFNKLLNELKNE